MASDFRGENKICSLTIIGMDVWEVGMPRQVISDAVIEKAAFLAKFCHVTVAEQHKSDLARFARIDTACEALESFRGCRPTSDDLVFADLSSTKRSIADVLATANLSARIGEAAPGLYLAIPYFYGCSDRKPVFLVNRTESPVTYVGRRLYAFASSDNGIDDYQASGSAFADGIASVSEVGPGAQIQIDEYSMSFDGDFMGSRRLFLVIDSVRTEWLTLVNKLGGHYPGSRQQGMHLLNRIDCIKPGGTCG